MTPCSICGGTDFKTGFCQTCGLPSFLDYKNFSPAITVTASIRRGYQKYLDQYALAHIEKTTGKKLERKMIPVTPDESAVPADYPNRSILPSNGSVSPSKESRDREFFDFYDDDSYRSNCPDPHTVNGKTNPHVPEDPSVKNGLEVSDINNFDFYDDDDSTAW